MLRLRWTACTFQYMRSSLHAFGWSNNALQVVTCNIFDHLLRYAISLHAFGRVAFSVYCASKVWSYHAEPFFEQEGDLQKQLSLLASSCADTERCLLWITSACSILLLSEWSDLPVFARHWRSLENRATKPLGSLDLDRQPPS